MMTAQEVYTRVRRHLLAQNEKSVTAWGYEIAAVAARDALAASKEGGV